MAAETQYTANTGMVVISTANSNLDGTGTLGTVLTAASNGTLVKRITVKAQGNVTQGMVRLFVYDGTNTRLLEEILIPAVTQGSTEMSFEQTIECNYRLQATYVLKASTQNAETFNVIAEGLNWAYYATSVRPESTNFTANTGMSLISTANSNLDGTGTLGTVLTAANLKGCRIESVTIKAIVNTSYGMVRLFISDGTNKRLLTEVFVPAITKSSVASSFSAKVTLGNFELQPTYSLLASTQNAESFAIIAEGMDWQYPA
jgi:hypothetical protein